MKCSKCSADLPVTAIKPFQQELGSIVVEGYSMKCPSCGEIECDQHIYDPVIYKKFGIKAL